MTKTTTKRRKRKNVKMRRTIRKTIAAIIMIMAVVVAAIPVEQLGTMQAATQEKSANLGAVYEAYMTATTESDIKFGDVTDISDVINYDKNASNKKDTQIMVQTSSSPLTYRMDTQFTVTPRTGSNKGYVIVDYNKSLGGGEIAIGEKLATDYFVITNGFLKEFKNQLSSETYTVNFKDDQANGNVTITLNYDDNGTSKTGTVSVPAAFNLTPDYSTTNRKTGDFTVDSKTYSFVDGLSTGMTNEYIFSTSEYAKGEYDTRYNDIVSYNNKVTTLKKDIASAQANQQFNATGFNELLQRASDLTTQYRQYKELTVSIASGIRNPDTFVQDAVIKRVSFKYDGSSIFNLLGFELVKMDDTRTGVANTDAQMVWAPKWNSQKNGSIVDYDKNNASGNYSDRSSHVDDNGFIVMGDMISVTGIGNNAFVGVDDPFSVKLSNQVEFIGNEAFKDCVNLEEIELAYCKAVGNRAFKGCVALRSVSFGTEESPDKAGVLGSEAFYGCTSLREVSFPRALTTIGAGCFATSGIQTATFSDNNAKRKMVIWPFTFYNCQALTNVNFPDVTQYSQFEIGLGAFALYNVPDVGNITSFAFPTGMTKIIANKTDVRFGLTDTILGALVHSGNTEGEIYYDYILAGRSALQYVTFPGTLSSTKIPDNTLMQCYNLECVTFGKCSEKDLDCVEVTFDSPDLKNGTAGEYDTDKDGETLFQDITNPAFYVTGPGFTNTNATAKPRRCTAAAQTRVRDYVPYKYMQDGQTQIEMSYGENNEYVAVVVIDDTNKTGTLKNFQYLNSTQKSYIRNLVIPDKIGEYTITKLGENCFENIRQYIIELTIEDGTISELDAEALKGAKNLQRVNIGNSVTRIGESAFAGCENLENVYFSSHVGVSDDGWGSLLTIGKDAFKTNSKYLTFHGEIHSDYAPFELAMSNTGFNGTANMRICYRTDEPQNLVVMWDNSTNKATLIDYPHYEEIDDINQYGMIKDKEKQTGITDYSIKTKFEVYQNWKQDSKYDGSMDEDERSVVMNTLMVNLPDGIDSIDAANFFSQKDKNRANFDYLNLGYDEKEDVDSSNVLNTIKRVNISRNINKDLTCTDVEKLYSDDTYGTSLGANKAGLFSGFFKEAGSGIVGHILSITESPETNNKEYVEENQRGNDNLTTVTMNSVETLPDYAFDSCENLLSVDIGSAMYDLGKLPFKNCSKLNSITTNKNNKYVCEQSIIYDSGNSAARASSGYTIVECLEPRGGANSPYSSQVKVSNDPMLANTTAIAEEAFSNAPYITEVDLTGTQIEEIPDGCFRDATNLMSVTVPKSVKSFGEDAFEGCNSLQSIFIYNPSCSINGAFGDMKFKGTVYGPAYVDQDNTEPSAIKNYCDSHNIKFESIGYVLKFYDYDHTLIEAQNIEPGKDGGVANGKAPEWTPNRSGYKFTGWECKLSDGTVLQNEQTYQNVTQNRTIYALYEPDGTGIGDGKSYKLSITGGKSAEGETSFNVLSGDAVAIVADSTDTTKTFQYWTASATVTKADGTTETVDYSSQIKNVHSAITTFVMPTAEVTITAHFTTGSSSSGSGSSGSGSGSGSGSNSGTSTDTETKYKLTVNYGSGSGEYKAGEVVTISAYAPESSTKVFSKWTTTNSGVGFASATSPTTTFTMPSSAVTITANYKTRTDDEDDDTDALNRRKTTSTSATVTTGTNNAASTNTVSTTTNTTASTAETTTQGDRIAIDKSGISNTNLGSTTVDGATDNFVVKISDSQTAVTDAQEALKNKYGSLDGIVYFPMDISLYDATGKNKISNTEGLNVSVTIPIPDELIQYGGNARVAAIENGQLQDLNVRFTTIDGIACMSFVPPHFSPYVVYVDTNNLVAGQMLDATPKTGDPIHPKWFLAIGMACLSVILFTTGDKKKKIKIA